MVAGIGLAIAAGLIAARFSWSLGDGLVIGFDVMVVDIDGRISKVHGFLDEVPA